MKILPRIRNTLLPLGPLAPITAFALLALAVFLLGRLTLAAAFLGRVQGVDHAWWLFPIGIRMDVITICLALFLPALLLLVLPQTGRLRNRLFAALFTGLAVFIVFMEASSLPFVEQYDSRPNRLFFEYLKYPAEVFGTLWQDYKLEIALASVLVALTARYTWRLFIYLLEHHHPWSRRRRLVVFPVVAVVLLMGARSSLGVRPANISTAAFSADHLVNEIALNSSYSVSYAAYRQGDEADAIKMYGDMPRDEVFARVARHNGLRAADFTNPDIPTLHHAASTHPRQRPLNLVIFLQESLGAEYVGSLGGLPLTPNFDALSKEGLLLTQLYSTGTRTVRGIEAVATGFPPSPSSSVLKLPNAQQHFFTVAELLKRKGYSTEFIYGGASHFDNMAAFMLGNGFEKIIDETDFKNPVFHGTWGVSDEDLVHRANDTFVAHGDKPFFALMLSTSNHQPFEYPAGRFEPYEQPANTVHNAMKYADYAIGEFFRLAKKEEYFQNTVFVVVADHNTRVYGADLVPVNKFHIPGLIIGPEVPVRHLDKVASQLDLLPTLLDLMGVDNENPMIGRNLLTLPESDPGQAIMQYMNIHAFMVGERVVVHQPSLPPEQFVYQDGRLKPAALEPEFARDGLAHVVLPNLLYKEQRYTLPQIH